MNKTRQFILGYDCADSNKLREYPTTDDAIYNSEEWCTVVANSLENAKLDYERQFADHKKAGRINGCM